VKDENDDLLADSKNILNRCSQLLNMHNVSDVRQMEVHTAESLVSGPSHLEVEIAIEKLKRYKSPGSVRTVAKLFGAGGETLLSSINVLILFLCVASCCVCITNIYIYIYIYNTFMELSNVSGIDLCHIYIYIYIFVLILVGIRRNCLMSGRSLLLYRFTKRTNCNNYLGISLLSASYTVLLNILFSRLSPCRDEIFGDLQCGFQLIRLTTDQRKGDHSEDQDVGGWVILRWVLERWDGVVWTGLV
jgi:hypothetical protein